MDDRRPTSSLLVENDLAVMRPGEKSTSTVSLGRAEYGGKVKKGFLRKIARNNSFRRKSDSYVNKTFVKKPTEMDGNTGSHEG